LSLIIYVVTSLLTPAPEEEEIEDIMWSKRYWDEESEEISDLPLWQNPRMLSLGIAVITVAMVAYFI
jgi:hypothetical protein